MTRITFIKRGAVQKVFFLETSDLAKARMVAEMQAGRGVKIIIEEV